MGATKAMKSKALVRLKLLSTFQKNFHCLTLFLIAHLSGGQIDESCKLKSQTKKHTKNCNPLLTVICLCIL